MELKTSIMVMVLYATYLITDTDGYELVEIKEEPRPIIKWAQDPNLPDVWSGPLKIEAEAVRNIELSKDPNLPIVPFDFDDEEIWSEAHPEPPNLPGPKIEWAQDPNLPDDVGVLSAEIPDTQEQPPIIPQAVQRDTSDIVPLGVDEVEQISAKQPDTQELPPLIPQTTPAPDPLIQEEIPVLTLKQWRDDILLRIDSLTFKKAAACRLFAFGPKAFPLLRGKNEEDVMMVAAELGNGRIIAVGHHSYIVKMKYNIKNPPSKKADKEENFIRFQKNAKQWLSKGVYATHTDEKHICLMDSLKDFKPCISNSDVKVVAYTGFNSGSYNEIADAEMEEEMMKWVSETGGGLLSGLSAQIWSTKEFKKLPWTHIPFYSVLLKAGIGLDKKKATPVKSGRNMDFVKGSNDNADIISLRDSNLYYLAKNKIQKLEDLVELDPKLASMFKIIRSDSKLEHTPDLRRGLLNILKHKLEQWKDKVGWPLQKSKRDTPKPGMVEPWWTNVMKIYADACHLQMGIWPDNKAPNVDRFPGDVSDPPPRQQNVPINIKAPSKNCSEFWSTGLYLLPGENMTITVTDETDGTWRDFKIWIGLHDDDLTLLPQDAYYRYPTINRKVQLLDTHTTLSSAFGGILFFESPPNQYANIKCSISGTIKSPQFILDDDQSMASWETVSRYLPGPWAEFKGKNVSIVVASDQIRSLKEINAREALEFFDTVLQNVWDLTDRRLLGRRREVILPDIQLKAGFLHSGYPIMCYSHVHGSNDSDKFFFNTYKTKGANWGYFHEMGHNNDRERWCPREAFSEVCANFFASYANEKVYGGLDTGSVSRKWLPYITDEEIREMIVTETFDYNNKNHAKVGVYLYSHLYHEFGWECYKKVFKTYEDDIENGVPNTFTDENTYDVAQEFMVRFSNAVGFNLCPMFIFYGFQNVNCKETRIQQFHPLFPMVDRDKFTWAMGRITRLIADFGGVNGLAGDSAGLQLGMATWERPTCYTHSWWKKNKMNVESAVEIEASLGQLESKMKSLVEAFKLRRVADLPRAEMSREMNKMNQNPPT